MRHAHARRGAPSHESAFHPGHLFMVQDQARAILRCIRNEGITMLDDVRILEIGCGRGRWLREAVQWGARPENVFGLDLFEDRVLAASRSCASGVGVQVADAANLPFADETFDIVLQSTVFTSILDDGVRARVAAEMMRVTRRQGFMVWYDFCVPSPNNPDVRAITKAEIRRLFSDCRISVRRLTLAPPIARFVAPRSWVLCTLLNGLPFLRTHLIAAIRR